MSFSIRVVLHAFCLAHGSDEATRQRHIDAMVRKHKCDWFGLPRSSNVLAQVCIICDVNAMQGRSK
uniref:Uncharacterized protein n=1 Tax=Oryza rufipogon TaxID=4529 RepID=A0A0E0R7X8_ORYRU